MNIIHTHIVSKNSESQRLSDYAVGIFESLPSRKSLKKAIKRGEVLVNGKPENTAYRVQIGDQVDLLESQVNPPKTYRLKLEVLYEDEELAIINKPAGIPVSGNQFRTIQNALMDNITPSKKAGSLNWPKPVHRLDAPTSGLLVIAKTANAIMALSRQFENREVTKTYVAVAMGEIPHRGTITFDVAGAEALTVYELLETVPSLKNGTLSLLKLSPKTGRTHQIRKHLAKLGTPILGDSLYGLEGKVLKGKGLFLSAIGLSFTHPETQEMLTIEMPVPYKFKALMIREKRRYEKHRVT